VMARTILLEYFHAREDNGVAARQQHGGNNAVSAGRGLADEVGEAVVLDNAQQSLRGADGVPVDQERGMRQDSW